MAGRRVWKGKFPVRYTAISVWHLRTILVDTDHGVVHRHVRPTSSRWHEVSFIISARLCQVPRPNRDLIHHKSTTLFGLVE